ncbi:hypothetical protein POTOM_042719 [Populus tomentosa]|uniref:FAS1 domain-containing protein n=1 Tax=Populus tomentosa TaxID=118781 RepID=A0A8X7YKE7_POPTO|nr:hypothetical protein POTOM_042719 [Populus tomentosa]
MKQQFSLFSFSLVLLFLHCTQTLSQSPTSAPAKAPAAASAPPPAATSSAQASPPVMVPVQVSKGPVNVIKILQKAGGFAVFIRLIKSTQEDIQVFSQLNDSRDGVTIFAPTDGAFSAIIKSGVLNSLSDHQKIELVQFHIIPRILTTANFQTVSNPITTLAGSGSRFALNVITTENMDQNKCRHLIASNWSTVTVQSKCFNLCGEGVNYRPFRVEQNAPSELVNDVCNESKELMAKIYGILEIMMHVLVFLRMDARTASAIITTPSKISIQLAISSTKYTNSNRACSIQHLLLHKNLFGLVLLKRICYEKFQRNVKIGKQQGSHHETYNHKPPCTPVLNVADLLITHLQLISPDQP